MLKCLILILLFTINVQAREHFWMGKTMSLSEVEKKWGAATFDLKKFKDGDFKLKSSMAAWLLKNQKQIVGKSLADIKKDFGTSDGFYFSDVYPAYLIQKATKDHEESWQIVFLLDEKRNVDKIIVHKNCCDE